MELHCEYMSAVGHENSWRMDYACKVTAADIFKPAITLKKICGAHSFGKKDTDVALVWFASCSVNYIPRGLRTTFANFTTLCIIDCGLKNICRDDLKGMENLVNLVVEQNDLTSLPDDLLVDLPNLKKISFRDNKIESMSSNMLLPMQKNKPCVISFRRNKKINAFYNTREQGSVDSLEILMAIIDAQCLNPQINAVPRKIAEPVKNPSKRLLSLYREKSSKVFESFFVTGKFSDFKIIMGEEKHFQVHKVILAAQSEGFADLFDNDTTVTEMKISDLSSESVEEFLHYLYTGEISETTKNVMEIYALASKLKVPELRITSEEIILKQLNQSNAFKAFTLAHSFQSDELKKAAFKVIQKMFPEKKMSETLIDNVPKVREILMMKEKMDALFIDV